MAENESKDFNQIKESIKVVEGFFQACNFASYPLQWHNAAMNGMQFLNQMHATLMGSLTPEQLAELKEAQKPKAPEVPITPEVVH